MSRPESGPRSSPTPEGGEGGGGDDARGSAHGSFPSKFVLGVVSSRMLDDREWLRGATDDDSDAGEDAPPSQRGAGLSLGRVARAETALGKSIPLVRGGARVEFTRGDIERLRDPHVLGALQQSAARGGTEVERNMLELQREIDTFITAVDEDGRNYRIRLDDRGTVTVPLEDDGGSAGSSDDNELEQDGDSADDGANDSDDTRGADTPSAADAGEPAESARAESAKEAPGPAAAPAAPATPSSAPSSSAGSRGGGGRKGNVPKQQTIRQLPELRRPPPSKTATKAKQPPAASASGVKRPAKKGVRKSVAPPPAVSAATPGASSSAPSPPIPSSSAAAAVPSSSTSASPPSARTRKPGRRAAAPKVRPARSLLPEEEERVAELLYMDFRAAPNPFAPSEAARARLGAIDASLERLRRVRAQEAEAGTAAEKAPAPEEPAAPEAEEAAAAPAETDGRALGDMYLRLAREREGRRRRMAEVNQRLREIHARVQALETAAAPDVPAEVARLRPAWAAAPSALPAEEEVQRLVAAAVAEERRAEAEGIARPPREEPQPLARLLADVRGRRESVLALLERLEKEPLVLSQPQEAEGGADDEEVTVGAPESTALPADAADPATLAEG